jgi:multicomponent K+:H+ antiporter subunit F
MPVLATTWDARLVDHVVDLGLLTVTAGIVLCLIRLVRGPHLADRAIALDTIAIHIIGLIILLTIRLNSLVLFDGALVMSLVGFAGTVAVAQYITRRRLKPQPTQEAS